HQKDHADDDTAMRREKADESPIWKTKAQVWRQYRLQRSADSPEICDLEPALISSPHRHNDNHHTPVPHLHRQHLLPRADGAAANENYTDDVVQPEPRRQNSYDHLFNAGRFCVPNNRGQRKRQNDREENDREVRQTVRLEFRLHALQTLYQTSNRMGRRWPRPAPLRTMRSLGASNHRITQRLHGMTSVTQALLLGSWCTPPACFCSGTTSKSAFMD